MRGLLSVADLVAGLTDTGATAASTAGATTCLRGARARAARPFSAAPLAVEELGTPQICGAASRKTTSVTLGTPSTSLPVLRLAIVRTPYFPRGNAQERGPRSGYGRSLEPPSHAFRSPTE